MPRRSYRRKSGRDYGRDRARAHIAAAHAFSAEVGNADHIVKDAFFSLSGSARTHLLDKYERLYGPAAKAYAQQTMPKWRSGSVQMSGMVAQRLFALMPPLMPIAQKHRVFEMIWEQYGPFSSKRLCFGPDSDPEAVLNAVEEYFDGLNVLYKIPSNLERRFDWLSDSDVAVKQQLLNHFMNEQRKVATASARLNFDMMLERMKVTDFAQISKLSHTLRVGNHQLEMRADPLQSGFAFGDSDRDAKKPLEAFGCAWTLPIVVIGLLFGAWLFGGTSHESSSQQSWDTAHVDSQGPGRPRAIQGVAEGQTRTEVSTNPPTSTSQYESVKSNIGAPAVAARVARVVVEPVSMRTPGGAVSNTRRIAGSAPQSGCSDTMIASMEDDGATIKTANGGMLVVSTSGAMRYVAAQWSTGDAVTICTTTGPGGVTNASVSNPSHYSKVQASLAGSEASSAISCVGVSLVRMSDNGATIDTTDGFTLRVSSAGAMRYESAQWSTGDAVHVCKTRLASGIVAASIENPSHYQKVQATVVGQVRAAAVRCKSASISSVGDGGSTVAISAGDSYSISSAGAMWYESRQWSTGDHVEICEAVAPDGSTAASIQNPAYYQKVQATRSR